MKRCHKKKHDYRNPIVIVCEGELEYFYFKRIRPLYLPGNSGGNRPIVEPICAGGKTRRSIVDVAAKQQSQSIRQVWCVMDIENPASKDLAAAVKAAEKHNICLALTNPCFDAWALAHLEPLTGVSDRSRDGYKQALKDRIGRGFSKKCAESFVDEILGKGYCNIANAVKYLSVQPNHQSVLNAGVASTNLQTLIKQAFPSLPI